jgi:hypothetical protein
MPLFNEIVIHGEPTGRSRLRYQFTPKHHGVDRNAAQWLPEMTEEDEFGVFDTADNNELTDSDGNLYGIWRADDGELRMLGTRDELVAEFPVNQSAEPWHGYPVYPLVGRGPQNRRGQRGRPEKEVFMKMEAAGLIDKRQRRRLMIGR